MKSYRELFLKHISQTSPSPLLLQIMKADGIKLYDITGKEYFDLIAGVSVANYGHNHSKIIEAIKNQADKYLHIMVYGEFIEEPQVLLAEQLTSLLPNNLNAVYFLNSGSEAIEGAMKIAKRFTGKTQIISCFNAYHGSTQGAMSLMSESYFTAAYRPLLPDINHIRFNNFDDLEKISSNTACVIIEPIQAEAGVILPLPNYFLELRNRCNETGTLLVFDEIQTGFGRTGSLFAFEQTEVIPDILVLGKALGAGLPLGAFITSSEISNSLSHNPILGHITTFGGHPLSCAAALAGLNILISENLSNLVKMKSDSFYNQLIQNSLIDGIRYSGLLMAVDLKSNENLFGLLPYLYQEGIHTDWFLFNEHSFRISPPLTIDFEEINQSVIKIENAIKKYINER